LIDRNTVFSYTTRLDQLSFIAKEKLDILKRAGVQISFGINPQQLDPMEKDALDLIHLKGLGYDHFLKLRDRGIDTIQKLSLTDENTISPILDEANMRRIRVYLKAAKKARYWLVHKSCCTMRDRLSALFHVYIPPVTQYSYYFLTLACPLFSRSAPISSCLPSRFLPYYFTSFPARSAFLST